MSPTGIGLIASALSGALVAGALGWGARGLVADHIQIPAVMEQQAELCTAATEKSAAEAVAAEQLRQFRVGELATEQFIRESHAAADDAQARRDLLELEINDYAQRVAEDGAGVCALDLDALDLIGVRPPAQPDRRGGR